MPNLLCSLSLYDLERFTEVLNQKTPYFVLAGRLTVHQRVKEVLIDLLLEETARALDISTHVAESCLRLTINAGMEGTLEQINRVDFYSNGETRVQWAARRY